MIKEFCDGCGHELTNDNRLPAKDGKVNIHSVHKYPASDSRLCVQLNTGDGEWCKFCVINLIIDATGYSTPRAS